MQKHNVLNEKNESVELCSSVECKGIIGNDGRHYILDLLRTFPPDLNFLPVDGEELPPESKHLGFPRQHRHRLACLRQELIEAFVEHRFVSTHSFTTVSHTVFSLSYSSKHLFLSSFRYLLFMKMAALQLMQQKANKDTKTDTPAIMDVSTEDKAEPNHTQTTTEESSHTPDASTGQTENSTASEENSSKPVTNGPLEPTATHNGKCKSPLEGKDLEESIPGLAQAKELAETLVAEVGSGIGTFKKIKIKITAELGPCRESYRGGSLHR